MPDQPSVPQPSDAPLRAAVTRLLDAVDGLADQEARRLGIPMVDPTYHGCDPRWRSLLNAAYRVRELVHAGESVTS